MSTSGPPLNLMGREERQQLLELAKAKRRAREAGGGLPASPGAAAGRVVLDPDDAVARAEEGEPVILVRFETSPDDFHGMAVA